MTKALIINSNDMGSLQKLVSGRCRTIVFRRDGRWLDVVLKGIGLKDYFKIRKPLKAMAIYME